MAGSHRSTRPEVAEPPVATSERPPVAPDPDAADRAAQQALARAAAGELLGPLDMSAIWHITSSQFYRRKQRGDFDVFLAKPAIGPRCYSGVLVHRYVSGEPMYEPTFGRKRGSR